MANPEHLAMAMLKQGVEVWNEWRQTNPGLKPDLREANLSRVNLLEVDLTDYLATLPHRVTLSWANLSGADLREADLRGAILHRANLSMVHLFGAILRRADLRGAILYRADLREADLREADFSRANLSGADLREADLNGADLREADLNGADLGVADLSEANLRGANLSNVILSGTTFSDVNLAEAKGLDTCHHWGPSYLDFLTLQRSGPLPLAFLRGCGLPDLLIDYLPSLLSQPIQFYSCFISYSSEDKDFAQRLHADLQNKGVRCWFAPKDIQGGRKIYEQIGEAIRLHEKLLLVLSEHSMSSKWVRVEIDKARQREEREKRQALFPIRLVDYETIEQ